MICLLNLMVKICDIVKVGLKAIPLKARRKMVTVETDCCG